MAKVYIGLGSNLDDPEARVRRAIMELQSLEDTRELGHSSLYRTAPVGPQDQADYINSVSCLATGLEPMQLLRDLQALEQRHGRDRRGERWGPRTLDLDILLYDEQVIDLPELAVPHPRLHERCFVLQPLLEIDPDIRIPGHGSGRDLLRVADCTGVRRLDHA